MRWPPFLGADMLFRKAKLDNGMTILMERMDTVRSVSLGIWVRAGARDEAENDAGISHFLEHMFFKGTESRSARDIAVAIDSLGGELNAFTTKEGTTFYIKVLDDFLDNAVELLADIFLRSTFPPDEIEREKGVVMEEIRMTEDAPDDYIYDIFSMASWGNESIGRPVLGTESSVGSLQRESLIDYVGLKYAVENTVISCAGNFNENDLLRSLNKAFKSFDRKGSGSNSFDKAEFKPGIEFVSRDLSEVHVCMGVEGIRQASDDRYTALVLNTVLGGGISSRLFQEIREKRGLAYSVYSFLSSYLDAGIWGIYAGTSPESVEEVVEICARELGGLPVTVNESEVERARTQLKGNIMLGLESTNRRMQNIANQEIYYGRYHSPEEVIKMINSVTLEDVRELGARLSKGKAPSMAALGPMAPGIEKSWENIRI